MKELRKSKIYWIYASITVLLVIASIVLLILSMSDLRTDKQKQADKDEAIRAELGYDAAVRCLRYEIATNIMVYQDIRCFNSIYCVRGSKVFYCKITFSEALDNKESYYRLTETDLPKKMNSETFEVATIQLIGNHHLISQNSIVNTFDKEKIELMLKDIEEKTNGSD